MSGGLYHMGRSGFFIIRPYDEKTILSLKGSFDGTNSLWIKKAMLASTSIRKNMIELDMRGVDTIDMAAMTLIIIALKALKDRGISTHVTGLDEKKRTLAHSLGMHCITRMQ